MSVQSAEKYSLQIINSMKMAVGWTPFWWHYNTNVSCCHNSFNGIWAIQNCNRSTWFYCVDKNQLHACMYHSYGFGSFTIMDKRVLKNNIIRSSVMLLYRQYRQRFHHVFYLLYSLSLLDVQTNGWYEVWWNSSEILLTNMARFIQWYLMIKRKRSILRWWHSNLQKIELRSLVFDIGYRFAFFIEKKQTKKGLTTVSGREK